MAKLLFQGHGSFRLTSNDGYVIYVDPYAGEGYDLPADLILVTHQHFDHNKIGLCARKPDCSVITNREALAGGKHNSFCFGGVLIQAVQAKNFLHSVKRCVGYIITIDGVKLYASGDTSKTKQMETFAALKLDYAILPGDGFFTMGLKKSADCARAIGAKNNIVIHTDSRPSALFSRKKAERWDAPNKIIIEPNQEIVL